MAGNTNELNAVVEAGYDKIADKYLAWTESRPSPRLRYVENFFNQLPRDRSNLTLLELGCGAGVPVTKYLASHSRVSKVFANDISTRQLELARQRVVDGHAEVTFLAGDMASLDFDARSLDGVLAFFSLIHLPLAAQRTTLEKIFSWLRPEGSLVCNFGAGKEGQPQPSASEQQTSNAFGDFLGAPMYWEEADVGGSLEMIRQAGFEVVESEIVDATDGKEVLDPRDPDAGVMFLWIVARKPLS